MRLFNRLAYVLTIVSALSLTGCFISRKERVEESRSPVVTPAPSAQTSTTTTTTPDNSTVQHSTTTTVTNP